MASISREGDTRRIQFQGHDGSRKTLRLGRVPQKAAEAILVRVEALLAARLSGLPLDRQTAAWLPSIGEDLRDRLARVGLIEPQKQTRLGEFLRNYVLARTDVKPATLEVWMQPCRNLIEFLGDEKPLRDITQGDGERFKEWLLTQSLAPATMAKRISFARTFLHTARKHRFIDVNPFDELKLPGGDASARQSEITLEMTDKLLAVASPTWRTIIALARLGGLRCPSEVLSLEWRHVDFEKGLIAVQSPKTSRYAGKASRTIPMFSALRPHLLEAFELAEPGATHVVGGGHLAKANGPTGWKNCNLRTTFEKIIRRAGLDPWPRLFHNLRSTCETDLLKAGFGNHVVAAWMGHSVKVSLQHYAQVTTGDFERAARNPTLNPTLQGVARSGNNEHTGTEQVSPEGHFPAKFRSLLTGANNINGEGGIRTSSESSEKLALLEKGDVQTDALARILAQIDALDPEDRERLRMHLNNQAEVHGS